MANHRTGVILGIGVALAGSIGAFVIGGPTIGQCLGPIVVTAVRCAAHGGGLPTTGAPMAQLVMAWCAGLLTAMGLPGTGWSGGRANALVAAGVVVGVVIGVAGYLAVRPLTLEGSDYDGRWLSIPLPIEPWSLAARALAGGLGALTALRLVALLRHLR